jgi:hypothetical protein
MSLQSPAPHAAAQLLTGCPVEMCGNDMFCSSVVGENQAVVGSSTLRNPVTH